MCGCLLGEVGDRGLAGAVCLAQGEPPGGPVLVKLGQSGDEEPLGHAGQEQGDAESFGGDLFTW